MGWRLERSKMGGKAVDQRRRRRQYRAEGCCGCNGATGVVRRSCLPQARRMRAKPRPIASEGTSDGSGLVCKRTRLRHQRVLSAVARSPKCEWSTRGGAAAFAKVRVVHEVALASTGVAPTFELSRCPTQSGSTENSGAWDGRLERKVRMTEGMKQRVACSGQSHLTANDFEQVRLVPCGNHAL